MAEQERKETEKNPGPKNKEPWAGKNKDPKKGKEKDGDEQK